MLRSHLALTGAALTLTLATVFAGPGDDTICLLTVAPAVTTLAAGDGADVVDADLEGGDVVNLGAGRDVLHYAGTPVNGQQVLGGPGHNTFLATDGHALRVNQRTGRLAPTADPDVDAHLSGFEELVVAPDAALSLVGDERREKVMVLGAFSGVLGNGNDVVELAPSATLHRYAGQGGYDQLHYRGTDASESPARATLLLDLRAGSLGVTGARELDAELDSVEAVSVTGVRRVRMIGDSAPNRLLAISTCTTRMDGGAGRDDLRVEHPVCSTAGARLNGGPANDNLVGSSFHDLLDGGAGVDTANGRAGFDRCLAEYRRGCERP